MDRRDLVCQSATVLGNGRLDDVRDLVVVDFHRFDRGAQPDVAPHEVADFNAELSSRDGVPYLLIGVGRWGSADPFLGIPVDVGPDLRARASSSRPASATFAVTPSQGTHFFQNLTASNIGYFTVNPDAGEGFVDWDWLAAQPAVERSVVRAAPPVRPPGRREDEREAERGRHPEACVPSVSGRAASVTAPIFAA